MPPREAKGRFLTREYMADAAFHRAHDSAERELYMMLALFTDDAGWLEWDPDYLTFTVYRYDTNREDTFDAGVRSLVASGRLKVYRCGHALMPKVAKRPRPGEHEYRVKKDHEARCRSRAGVGNSRPQSSRPPDLTLPNLTLPDKTSKKSSYQSRERARGTSERPRGAGGLTPIGDELTEFQQRVPRPAK